MRWVDINLLFSLMCIVAAGLNFVQILRAERAIRWHRAARTILFAYEKELLERGITLPVRCAYCCQILPKHVDGCVLIEYHPHDRWTRPNIKYYPDGSRPPSLEGK